MKKSILKLLIVITITSLILLLFVGCKSPETTELEERIEKLELEKTIKELEDELAKKEAEETSPEEEEEEVTEETNETEEMEEEEDGEEETGDADSDTDADTDTNTDADDIDKEAPTISLAVYAGPTLDGSICYYRVEATVTGSPSVSFSKDDSGGAWGSKKVQINLNDPTDTYTLTATATNSEGSATDSIALSWGCVVPTLDPIETGVDIGIDIDSSGFIIVDVDEYSGGPLAYLGDWDNNKPVVSTLNFDISSISSLDDVTIKDVSVTIPVVGIVNNPEKIDPKIVMVAEGEVVMILYTSPSLNNLNFSGSNLEDELQKAVDVDKQKFRLVISIGYGNVLANDAKDYYKIHAYSAVLHIKYEIPG